MYIDFCICSIVYSTTVQFGSYANKVTESFRAHTLNRLMSLEAFATAITSHARAAKLEWPLVTVPDFAARGMIARQDMGAETIGFLPLVTKDKRESWESFSLANQWWIQADRRWEQMQADRISGRAPSRSLYAENEEIEGNNFFEASIEDHQSEYMPSRRQLEQEADFSTGISSNIYTVSSSGSPVVDEGSGPYLPIWQISPAPSKLSSVNYNLLSHPIFWQATEKVVESRQAVLSEVLNLETDHKSFTGVEGAYTREPISALYYPVFSDFFDNRTLVGMIATEIDWNYFFQGALPDSAHGIICVVENACNQQFTYKISGETATYVGAGDLHDHKFDRLVESRSISYLSSSSETFAGAHIDYEYCPFTLHVYPSEETQEDYESHGPMIYIAALGALFLIATAILIVYDKVQSQRYRSDMQSIVVLERLFPQDGKEGRQTLRSRVMKKLRSPKLNKKGARRGMASPHFRATLSALPTGFGAGKDASDPFSNATVLFADIGGLDEWSTNRDPEEKEAVLETVHRSLNVIAKRHGVFQVEMAGDCFIAVAGVQHSEDDHAVIMAIFASDCRKRMIEHFKNMNLKGLSMRFGIHSGHVQAGLYESDDSRFQLFGDTVDTTYQMLTSGKSNKIHLSVETAELLNLAGKHEWISPRNDLVVVKGKGAMSTFWIKPKACLAAREPCKMGNDTASLSDTDSESWEEASVDQRVAAMKPGGSDFQNRVDWNYNILLEYLKKIQARQNLLSRKASKKIKKQQEEIGMGDPVIEEAKEPVKMPTFDPRSVRKLGQTSIDLGPDIESQLRLYVSSIASTYRGNSFHCFEHATHATMAMDRMLKRIASLEDPDPMSEPDTKQKNAKTEALEHHNRTFGIGSDPLTQFALIFSALIHDVDHVGVSNYQLIKEESPIAGLYKNKSVSEQNSVDIAWWLLMTPNFSNLRECIGLSDAKELRRFRQVLVNSVIATDILDIDLKVHRDKTWAKAFRKASSQIVSNSSNSLKATAVIEHLMQAADAAHTLESYHVYLEWGERQFEEIYEAYHDGRSERNPADSWYISELCFFDNFVIPLAKRLRDSGVFGRAGSDFLKHAQDNRKQWEDQGNDLVREMVEGYSRKVAAGQEETICFT
jgi:class 3 adenylate cyclase